MHIIISAVGGGGRGDCPHRRAGPRAVRHLVAQRDIHGD